MKTLNQPIASDIRIDWISIVFRHISGKRMADYMLAKLWQYHRGKLAIREAEKGRNGYTRGFQVFGKGGEVGSVWYGGENQRGTVHVELRGGGCCNISPEGWKDLCRFLESRKNYKINRMDLAADFHGNQIDIRDLYNQLQAHPEYTRRGGQTVKARWVEGWDNGSSIYVGGKFSGVEACIYEKGKQLGIADSDWVRMEMRFRNRGCILDTYMLQPELWWGYWREAYPFLGKFYHSRTKTDHLKPISLRRPEFENDTIQIMKAVLACRKQYGKLINTMFEYGMPLETIIGLLKTPKLYGPQHPTRDFKEMITSTLLHELYNRKGRT